ncbi:MAG: hypothetical protein IT378_08450 [Sandaracinaceae bacterium]|nr:hypothetical protein [Sandaracinaceae bacterium]
MCCFSARVEHVSATKIFVRAEGPRQLVVYEMSLVAQGELAMVLPIPIALGASEDAVEMVDLSQVPTFFTQLGVIFDSQRLSFAAPSRLAPQSKALKVHQVGAFEASFVPRAIDFDRLDPRFAIPSSVWAGVPAVAGFGFVVFKLRETEPPGLVDRVLGRAAASERTYHPMAFWFPRRDTTRLFLPTLHIHDGSVHETADFDHVLYAQASIDPPGWESSNVSLQQSAWGELKRYVADAPGQRATIKGTLPNKDTWIAA